MVIIFKSKMLVKEHAGSPHNVGITLDIARGVCFQNRPPHGRHCSGIGHSEYVCVIKGAFKKECKSSFKFQVLHCSKTFTKMFGSTTKIAETN